MTLKKVRSFKSKDLLNKKQCWHKNGLKNLQDNSLDKYKDHHKPTEDDGWLMRHIQCLIEYAKKTHVSLNITHFFLSFYKMIPISLDHYKNFEIKNYCSLK